MVVVGNVRIPDSWTGLDWERIIFSVAAAGEGHLSECREVRDGGRDHRGGGQREGAREERDQQGPGPASWPWCSGGRPGQEGHAGRLQRQQTRWETCGEVGRESGCSGIILYPLSSKLFILKTFLDEIIFMSIDC